MVHMRLGEDPQWALVRDRERLQFTDPPSDSPPTRQRPHISQTRIALGVVLALAITTIVHADTAPADMPSTTSIGHLAHAAQPDNGDQPRGPRPERGITRQGHWLTGSARPMFSRQPWIHRTDRHIQLTQRTSQ